MTGWRIFVAREGVDGLPSIADCARIWAAAPKPIKSGELLCAAQANRPVRGSLSGRRRGSGRASMSLPASPAAECKARIAMVAVAKPPSRVKPVKTGRSQRFSWPSLQYGQTPQVWPTHGMPTRSPMCSPSTPAPSASMRANDLVAWNDLHFRIGQLAIYDVQVCAADAAGRDLHTNLACSRLPVG